MYQFPEQILHLDLQTFFFVSDVSWKKKITHSFITFTKAVFNPVKNIELRI